MADVLQPRYTRVWAFAPSRPRCVRWTSLSVPVALIVVFAIGAGCAKTPPPAPVAPAIKVIPLGPSGSRPLVFLHVVERIPAGTVVGVHRSKRSGKVTAEIRASGNAERSKIFNTAINVLLKEHGYNVLDEVDAVFDSRGAVRARFALAGVVHDWDVERIWDRFSLHGTPKNEENVAVKFELQVHDLVMDRTIFQHTYDGTATDEGNDPQAYVPAVVDAMMHALADPRFVSAVSASDPIVESASEEARRQISVAGCSASRVSLPEEIDRMLDSIVVIRVGGTTGAGVIVSGDGHVMTSAHVVGDLDDVFASLRSGPMIPARVVSRDPRRDLALLKLPGHGYRCAALRAPGDLAVGSDVFTVNIFVDDRAPTVARGVVSGYPEIDGRRYLQTDATINPGSSGGPIFDQAGAIGAIVSSKIVGEGFEGLGFGVPIDEAARSLHIDWE